jgi:glutathione synthase/RimK-type ligase-like ATP-grasp enzyme
VTRWNTHKRYLSELADRGVAVVPTVAVAAGSGADLALLLAQRGWGDAVVKAAVAQSGRYAKRISAESVAAGQIHLDRFLRGEDMLVQPYLPSVVEEGELSLVYVEGEFTHAVRKRVTTGDFRVHDDYGGSVHPEPPSADQLALARAALDVVGEPTLYARVDVVADESGSPVIMEFELVEPELFLRFSPDAVERLSDGIARRLA